MASKSKVKTGTEARRTKTIVVQVTPEEHDRYRDLAWQKRKTLSDIIREHLESLAKKLEAK